MRRVEVDVVIAGAAERDQARAAARKLLDHGCVEAIVDEDADAFEARGERDSLGIEMRLEESQLMLPAVGRFEELAVVCLAAENRDSHRKGGYLPASVKAVMPPATFSTFS